MKRFLLLSGLLMLAMIGVAGWMALRTPPAVLVAPGALDINVRQISISEQLVAYRSPGPPYAWRVAVASDLQRAGWVNPLWWRTDMPVLSYTKLSSWWFGTLWTQADLRGEPNGARIIVRRWLEVRWWQYLPRQVIKRT